ncbi:MAG TPA: hypothetical protein VGB50_06585 [Flavobacterium sp.]
MRTLRTKYLCDIAVEEDHYKVDFHILDKYQGFSAEILRLALIGLAVFGFLLSDIIFKVEGINKTFILLDPFVENIVLFGAGALMLLAAALCALGHRYFSTDCMTHFVRRYRLRQQKKDLNEVEQKTAELSQKIMDNHIAINSEDRSFEKDLSLCKWLLLLAAVFLIVGIFILLYGIGLTLSGINNFR